MHTIISLAEISFWLKLTFPNLAQFLPPFLIFPIGLIYIVGSYIPVT